MPISYTKAARKLRLGIDRSSTFRLEQTDEASISFVSFHLAHPLRLEGER